MAQRRPQGVAGVGDAAAAEGPGGLVEPPVPGGQAVVLVAGQEVELCFHVSILPRGCDSQTWPATPGPTMGRSARMGSGALTFGPTPLRLHERCNMAGTQHSNAATVGSWGNDGSPTRRDTRWRHDVCIRPHRTARGGLRRRVSGEARRGTAGRPRRRASHWILSSFAVVVVLLLAGAVYVWSQVHSVLSVRNVTVSYTVPDAPHLVAGNGETVYRIDPTHSSMTYGVDENLIGQTANHATGSTNGIAGDLASNSVQPVGQPRRQDRGQRRAAPLGQQPPRRAAPPALPRLRDLSAGHVLDDQAHRSAGVGRRRPDLHLHDDGQPDRARRSPRPVTWKVTAKVARRQARRHRHHHGEDVHLRGRPHQPGRPGHHGRRRWR